MGNDRPNRTGAVWAYCYECSGGSYHEVEKCHLTGCPLYHYRNRKATKDRWGRKLSEGQKRKMRDRLKKAREK